ncbi:MULTISPECIES: hypothetical protein [Serratia]|uniref:hypothetical protein n=1 Tax=Serratia TaxID=613 RepID=UPI001113ED30|nr:hypothetical protein [Serratia marcescens]MBN5203668.1 hypothetical protein [Serratia marcescens]
MEKHIYSVRDQSIRVNALESVVRSLLSVLTDEQAKAFISHVEQSWARTEQIAPEEVKQQLSVTKEAAFDIASQAKQRYE